MRDTDGKGKQDIAGSQTSRRPNRRVRRNPHKHERTHLSTQSDTVVRCGAKWVRLVPNGRNLGFFRSDFSSIWLFFWISPIWAQSVPTLGSNLTSLSREPNRHVKGEVSRNFQKFPEVFRSFQKQKGLISVHGRPQRVVTNTEVIGYRCKIVIPVYH